MNWNQQTKYLLLCFEVSKWCCLELSMISLPCLVKLLEFWNGGECSTWPSPWRRVLSLLLPCGLFEISRQIVFWKGKLVLGWSRWTHKIRVAFWVTIEIKSLVVLCANCSGNVMVLLLLSYFLMLLVGFLLMLQLLWSKSLFCSSTYLCVAVVRLKPIIVWLCSWFMGAVLVPRQLVALGVRFCFWIARLYVATYFGFSSLGMILSSDPFYLYVSSFSS